jgi:hypothetical protein
MTHLALRRPILSVAVLAAAGLLAGCASSTTPSPSPAPSQPAPSASATPVPTTAPTTTPTPEPTPASTEAPSPSVPADGIRFDVPLTIATSHTVTAHVVDWTGGLTAATSGTPGDGASVPFDEVVLANDGPSTLVVTWAAGPCDSTPSVVLDGTTLTVVQVPCEGDAIAFDRIVRLDFATPIDAASLTGVLQPEGDTAG